MKSNHISHKCKSSIFICLTYIRITIYIEVIFIPFFYFIFW